ncbi:tellurite resistance TerB family protein [Sneathiella sp. CAU 1612]|uniref:Tellurite resistance TerB family protein n=1 Tax=Sneathiella sedimenti TaxID=2816034 RepID=A0ABS3F0N2_9PROT|nr:tellurite resistance TerB family protein [Sneathiella sedimenti]MBO0332053.1 tellurite resistance TerB family protein [Sneathiella sedimenti]
MTTLNLHTALISTMVIVSAADREMTDRELFTIGEIVRTLPVFADYEEEHLPDDAATCVDMLNGDQKLEEIIGKIRAVLPKKIYDTAYALACDVAVSDGQLSQEELRMLEMLRHGLDVDRLTAAAIERGSAVRYARI